MRLFVLLVCLSVSAFCSNIQIPLNGVVFDLSKDPYILEDQINETIEGLRPSIPDPLEIPILDIVLPNNEGDIITGNASIANLVLTGLQGFQIPALNFDLFALTLNITLDFPALDLYTDFDLNLALADALFIYGTGNITLNLDSVDIQVSAPVDITDGLKIAGLRIQVALGNATIEVHGLLNDEELSHLLGSILNDLAVGFINDNQELITQILSPIAEEIINAIIAIIFAPDTTTTDETTETGTTDENTGTESTGENTGTETTGENTGTTDTEATTAISPNATTTTPTATTTTPTSTTTTPTSTTTTPASTTTTPTTTTTKDRDDVPDGAFSTILTGGAHWQLLLLITALLFR